MKLAKLTNRVAMVQPQRLSQLQAADKTQPQNESRPQEYKRKPWEKSALSPKRMSGRKLQTRNFRIKLRDRFTCQCGCGRIGTERELEIDHRVPLYDGGTEDDSNLQTMLIECHERKSQAERNEISKARPRNGQ
jgi:5-methylcytosine-specific restriction protein A